MTSTIYEDLGMVLFNNSWTTWVDAVSNVQLLYCFIVWMPEHTYMHPRDS
jgi:hypothetical protein